MFGFAVIAFVGGLGMQEMIIIGVIAVLLFGKRLPEVAKSVGKSYNEFRRGLSDIQSDMSTVTDSISQAESKALSKTTPRTEDREDFEEATAPKFEPPPAEPKPVDTTPAETPAREPKAAESARQS